jgi:hypothetical protein
MPPLPLVADRYDRQGVLSVELPSPPALAIPMVFLDVGVEAQARIGPAELRSVLGPCRNVPLPASAVTAGHRRFGETAGRRPSNSCSWDNAEKRFRL